VAAACWLTAAVALAADPPSPQALREQLIPVYRALETDPQFLALRAGLESDTRDAQAMDRYLRYLPMSPKELLEIDMFLNRYEIMVPRQIMELHRRWVRLHPELARAHYGQAAVEKVAREYVPYVLAGGATQPLGRAVTVGTNRNAATGSVPTPPTGYQGEIQVVVNPNNVNQVVAASNTFANGPQSIFYSADGGATWDHTFPPDVADFGAVCPAGFNSTFGSDPALAWNANNQVFLEYMLLCSSGSSQRFSIRIARSVDGGATWTAHGTVVDSFVTGTLEDKEFLEIDTNPGSPFSGRMYTCWDRGNNEKSAWSSDGGVTWTEVDLPAAPVSPGPELGCDLATTKDGAVHIVWDTLNCGATSCSNERMHYLRSTDGGLTWSTPLLLVDFNLVAFSGAASPPAQNRRNIGPFGAIDADNSGGVCDGNLYVAFSDYAPAGEDVNDTDVFMIRSTDGGTTWSAPRKANDDGLANRVQFHPTLRVDQITGDVVIGWHDARNDAANREVDYFLARSTDCGASFVANIQASQPSAEFNNSAISFSNENSTANVGFNPNQYGEYLGVDAHNGQVYFAWTDTRHFFPGSTAEPEDENLGFALVSLTPPVIFADGFESGDTSSWSNTVP